MDGLIFPFPDGALMGLLDRVTSQAPAQPSRVYLYAAEKWGKTSFAAHAPKPVFVMTAGETGLLDLINYGQIGPTPHFPEDMKTWPDLLDAVRAVADEPHDYQTLVIDTANGAERLLADHVLHNEFNGVMAGKNGYGGYGKGDMACVPHWTDFLRALDRVRSRRRMSIVLLAHSRVKTVNNPEGDDYDQLRPEGIDKLWPLTHKWASVIAAGTYRVFVKDDKAQGGRDRVIRLQGTAAVVGGNRYGLPAEIACGTTPATAWSAFAGAIRAAKAKAAAANPAPAASVSMPASPPPPPPPAEDPDPDPEVYPDPGPLDPAEDPPPVDPQGDAPRVGGEMVQRILAAAHELGLSWREARDQFGRECGFVPSGGMHVNDLPADAGLLLLRLLAGKVAEKKAKALRRAGKKAEAAAEESGVPA